MNSAYGRPVIYRESDQAASGEQNATFLEQCNGEPNLVYIEMETGMIKKVHYRSIQFKTSMMAYQYLCLRQVNKRTMQIQEDDG